MFSSAALSKAIHFDLSHIPDVDGYPFDVDLRTINASVLRRTIAKKATDAIDPGADALAYEKFLEVNRRCHSWYLQNLQEWEAELLGELKQQLYQFFYPSGDPLLASFGQFADRGRTGPGSSLGSRGTDLYTKLFSGDLTTTSRSLYDVYRSYVGGFPRWHSAEVSRAAKYGVHVVECSRLSFVPKNNSISRVICTEPVVNMFFQLGLGEVLGDRLRSRFGIDLATQQPKNRRLARLGSRTGSFSTIDLESASDSLSMWMLREVLPPSVLSWLELFRTPRARAPKGVVELGMVSTMGNGFTFPLQTVLFSCVVAAVYRYLGVKTWRKQTVRSRPVLMAGTVIASTKTRSITKGPNFGVFGDDIICRSETTRWVVRLLEILGFKVNAAKSFVEGPFRESCGGDYFKGTAVRGVYVKDLSTQESRCIAFNNLQVWSARTGISLPLSSDLLLRGIRGMRIPFSSPIDAGIRVPSQLAPRSYDKNGSLKLKARLVKDYVMRFDDEQEQVIVPRGEKSRAYNADGLLLAFLKGDIRRGKVGLRSPIQLYRTKWSVTPNWDHVPRVQRPESFCWRRWVTVVLNAFGSE